MRTKTLILSALLGALGSVSVHAQNVYSLNTVGYINVTVAPGFNIISCPLIGALDPISGLTNTIGTLLNNGSGQYNNATVWSFNTATGMYTNDTAKTKGNANTNGWVNDGQITMLPGQAVWFQNPYTTNLTLTFVGQVTTGQDMANPISIGFNLISSILPMSGDLVTNSLSDLTPTPSMESYNGTTYTNPTNTPSASDSIWVYSPAITNYITYSYTLKGGASWKLSGVATDPVLPYVGAGFWYDTAVTNVWLETYNPTVTNYITAP
jgi:hypothetical protein